MISISHKHTKKRDLLLCSAFQKQMLNICSNKKAGLRAAVPLYEALVLPFIPNKQHRSPRRICTHTRVPINTRGTRYTYPEDINCCNVLE